MKKRYYLIFSGRVQGVGFRFMVTTKAKELNITGKIKNLDNGMVEMYMEGEINVLNTLLSYILSNPAYIHIDDYQIKEVPIKNDSDFKITY